LKSLPGSNALAYLTSLSMMTMTSFISLTTGDLSSVEILDQQSMEWKAGPGRDVIKLFFYVNGGIENRIEWLPQASLFGNYFL
jgi:hypothetical protein